MLDPPLSDAAIDRAAALLVAAMEQQGYRLTAFGRQPDGSVLVAMHEDEVSLDVLKFFSDWLLARHHLGSFTIHTLLVQQGLLCFRIIEVERPPQETR